MNVYSDYPILDPVFLFPADATARPGFVGSVTVTQLGGTVTIQGYQFSMTHNQLPPLKPGTECVLLLQRKGDRYQIAGTFYGAFEVTAGDQLAPLFEDSEFAKEYRGMRVGEATAQLTALRKAAK
jgi:hypothetical protein